MNGNTHKPVIVAHRGLHDQHPENSLAAFRAAWEAGIDWCECDVRNAACHTPVVFHDDTLDRMTTLRGPVDRRHWKDLSQARLQNDDGTITGEAVCALSPLIRELRSKPSSPRHLLVEIKSPCHHTLPRTVMECLDIDHCAVQSFDAQVLMEAHRENPRLPSYFLTESPDEADRQLSAPWTGVNFRHDVVTSRMVSRLHGGGKQVGVWTPNSEADLRRAIALGVDWIITDAPRLARATRDNPPKIR